MFWHDERNHGPQTSGEKTVAHAHETHGNERIDKREREEQMRADSGRDCAGNPERVESGQIDQETANWRRKCRDQVDDTVGRVGERGIEIKFGDEENFAERNERKHGTVERDTNDEYKPECDGKLERIAELDLIARFDRLRRNHASTSQIEQSENARANEREDASGCGHEQRRTQTLVA